MFYIDSYSLKIIIFLYFSKIIFTCFINIPEFLAKFNNLFSLRKKIPA